LNSLGLGPWPHKKAVGRRVGRKRASLPLARRRFLIRSCDLPPLLQDGLAYPFLWFPLYLLLDDTTSESIKDFITVAVLYEVVLGILVGAVLGYVFAKVMHFMEKQGFIGPDSYVVQFVAMTVFIEGIVALMGNDDLLASFAAGERACGADQPASYLTKRSTGSAISWDGHFNEQTEDNAVFASLVESKFCRYD
jgi:hypothetical protein